MEIHIYGDNYHVSEAIEQFAHRKLDKLDRYLPNILDTRIDLTREHTRRGEDRFIAQITIRHARGAILRAEESNAGDMETALLLATDKLYRQISRFKGKQSRKGRERFSATLEELMQAEAFPPEEVMPTEPEAELDDFPEPEIIRRKDVMLTPMTEDEAIEQMELLGHTFFIFLNSASHQMHIVYKRRAGDYGLIVPHIEEVVPQ